MPMKGTGAGELTVVDRFDGGVGWIAYPEETMRRTAHAIESDDGLWILDPVDAEGLDERLGEYADPAGVVVLLDRHKRDAAAIATRHDVPVYVPDWMDGVAEAIDAPTRRVEDRIGDFQIRKLIDNRIWQEAVLFDGETLVVPEAVGTASYFTTGDRPLGVHPMLRLRPPRRLTRLTPERVLVGHGEGIHEDATTALEAAIRGARRRTPRLALETARSVLPF